MSPRPSGPPVQNRYRQLVRCLRLRRLVAGRAHVQLDALASQLRVSERTIRRDLIALHIAGEDVPSFGAQKDMVDA
jgi:predicted DNA-binding transcriptional regulator YafY